MHFARLVKQASVDLVYDQFVYLGLTWCIVQCGLALTEPGQGLPESIVTW